MRLLTLLLFVVLVNAAKAQLPIGKDFKSGLQEVKVLLRDKNQTLMKEFESELSDGTKYYHLMYKEEFRVTFQYNDYEVIEMIKFNTGLDKVKEMIEEILEKSNWKYNTSFKDSLGNDLIEYSIHGYYGRYFYNPDERSNTGGNDLVYQYIISRASIKVGK